MIYIEKMKVTFFQEKDFYPEDFNMLLDFCKKSYVHNNIDFLTYKKVLKELYELGVESPSDINSLEVFKT